VKENDEEETKDPELLTLEGTFSFWMKGTDFDIM